MSKMSVLEIERIIDVPIDMAWEVITDMEGYADITTSGITKVEVLGRVVGHGTAVELEPLRARAHVDPVEVVYPEPVSENHPEHGHRDRVVQEFNKG